MAYRFVAQMIYVGGFVCFDGNLLTVICLYIEVILQRFGCLLLLGFLNFEHDKSDTPDAITVRPRRYLQFVMTR